MSIAERKPLPPGSIIEFCGDEGKVIHDPGGNGRIEVDLGDFRALWYWSFEGVDCTVIAIAQDASVGVER